MLTVLCGYSKVVNKALRMGLSHYPLLIKLLNLAFNYFVLNLALKATFLCKKCISVL